VSTAPVFWSVELFHAYRRREIYKRSAGLWTRPKRPKSVVLIEGISWIRINVNLHNILRYYQFICLYECFSSKSLGEWRKLFSYSESQSSWRMNRAPALYSSGSAFRHWPRNGYFELGISWFSSVPWVLWVNSSQVRSGHITAGDNQLLKSNKSNWEFHYLVIRICGKLHARQ
jgi:hypothetical protein